MSPRALVLSLGVSGFAVCLWLNTSLKPRSSSGEVTKWQWTSVVVAAWRSKTSCGPKDVSDDNPPIQTKE